MTHACATEEEVYELLGLAYVPPELRENRGELEAARDGELPDLVTRRRTYAATCTATPSPRTGARRSRRWPRRRASAATSSWPSPTTRPRTASATTSRPTRCAATSSTSARSTPRSATASACWPGSEVNVLPDGALDYDDELLAELDWVVASLHSSFRMGEQEMTDRMVRAIEHPLVDAIGHPDGPADRAPRALRARPRPGLRGRGAHRHLPRDQRQPRPPRPLGDQRPPRGRGRGHAGARLRRARRRGACAIVGYAVATARRAWLGPDQVANTRPVGRARRAAQARRREGAARYGRAPPRRLGRRLVASGLEAPEARRAHQPGRLERRGPLDVEAHAVAPLDRRRPPPDCLRHMSATSSA